MAREGSNRSVSPVRRRSSPRRKSPARRERSPPPKRRSSHRGDSPARDSVVRGREKHERSVSPETPRTKRSRRVQAEREGERERKPARHDGDGNGDRRNVRERSERRSGRDDGDQRPRNKRESRSPPTRPRDEVPTARESEQMNDEDDPVSKMEAAEKALAAKKEKPSFELSGNLAAETNRVRGVTLLFNEPPEAAKPDIRWRLYVFKNGEALNEPLYIHRQSCYLFGRERRVADIPTDHPSCSKQHAVIQYRKVEFEKPDGMIGKQVRPYIMDLGSTNKTFLNEAPIEPQRYYELRERDTIKFGNSSREYVVLHENSAS